MYSQLNQIKTLIQDGELSKAESILRQLISSPQRAVASYLLGRSYCQTSNYQQALPLLQSAVDSQPTRPDYHNVLGNCYSALGQLDMAIRHYRKSVQLQPGDPYILYNLGDALKDQGDFSNAIQCFQHILSIDANFLPAWVNLGNIFKDKGELKLSLSYYERAFQLNPTADIHSKMILAYRELPGYSENDLFKALKHWEHLHKKSIQTTFTNSPDPDKKLRIGYLSANLYNHSTAGVFELLFKHHSSSYQLHIYSDAPFEDQVTQKLKGYHHIWLKSAEQSHQWLKDKILADNIDILVDLVGHMDRNRLELLSEKIAPIQVTGLGFGLSTGLSAVDYIFSDPFYTPTQHIKYNAEKVWYLSSANHWIPPDYTLEPSPCPFEQNGYITFGSGNTLFKLNQEVLELWAKLLMHLPKSRLFLKAKGLNQIEHQEHYIRFFTSRGIQQERLIFSGGSNHYEHLKFYQLIDIALDPFPLNGGITTCEAFWMGVPVVSMLSRVRDSHSIFNLHNIVELLAQNNQEYLSIAINLSKNVQKLHFLRQDLRKRMLISPMCNGKEFVKEVENAYRLMWRKWCTKICLRSSP